MKHLILITYSFLSLLKIQATINWGTPKIGSDPADFIVVGNKMFFTASDSIHRRGLWVTDGTEKNTVFLLDIYLGPRSLSLKFMDTLNGELVFLMQGKNRKATLWKSNGTRRGTLPVAKLYCDSSKVWLPNSYHFMQVIEEDIFIARSNRNYTEWIRLDKNLTGFTVLTKYKNENFPFGKSHFNIGNSCIFFSTYTLSMGCSKTYLKGLNIKTGETTVLDTLNNCIEHLTCAGDTVFYSKPFGPLKNRKGDVNLLAKASVGTKPHFLRDGNGNLISYPSQLTSYGSNVVFHYLPLNIADSSIGSMSKAICYNNNLDNTILLDSSSQLGYGSFSPLFSLGEQFFVQYKYGDPSTYSLYASKGTEKIAELIKPIWSFGDKSRLDNLFWTTQNHEVYFVAMKYLHGFQIWKTDGTPEGTVQVSNIKDPHQELRIKGVAFLNGKIIFRYDDRSYGSELYTLDPNTKKFKMVKNIAQSYIEKTLIEEWGTINTETD